MERQWQFRPYHLENTPSTAIDHDSVFDEITRRNSGIEFLFRIGLQLKLAVPVLATACVFFHRFYMRQSIEGHIIYDVAGACIFLACKVEESGRKLKDVAAVCQSKAAGTPLITADQDPAVLTWTKTILGYEELLLETLCFDLTIEHPYNDLLTAAETLNASDHLMAMSWSVLNDTFRTPLCVLYSPRVLACSSYILSLHNLSPRIPLSNMLHVSHTPLIFEAFHVHPENEGDLISDVISLLLDFYNHIQHHVPEKLWRLNPFVQTTYDIQPAFSFQMPGTPTPPTTSPSQETISTI